MQCSSNKQWILRYVFSVFASILPAATSAAVYQFNDGTFTLNDYSISVFNNLPPPNTAALSQKLTGGNPGAWAAVHGTLLADNTSNAIYAAALVNPSWIYSPAAQGPITSISFSLDRFNSSVSADTQVAATLVAVQGTTYYFTSVQGPVIAGTWETILAPSLSLATGWNSFNFSTGAVTTGANPNFGTGSPITFGFALTVQPPSLADVTGTLGADNISITISSVPEPRAALLVLAGLYLVNRALRTRRNGESAA